MRIRRTCWRVEAVHRSPNVTEVRAVQRDERRTFLLPFDRVAPLGRIARPRAVGWREARARLAGMAASCHTTGMPLAAITARLTLYAYQLEPVLALIHGARRIILADEVGLGKTVQAGLAIAEIIRRHHGARVLIVAPSSLHDQWRNELAERLHLASHAADAGSLTRAARETLRGRAAWDRSGVWIASADYLKQPHVLDDLPRRPWDLVVIDEAHTAAGASERHTACDRLARRARHVLLLTATPHSGDHAAFARLIDLGAWRTTDDAPVFFRRTRSSLGLDSGRRVRWMLVRPSPAEHALLDVLAAFERTTLRAAGPARRDAAAILLAVFRKRALSTTVALRVSLERRLAWLDGTVRPDDAWTQPSLDFGDPSDDLDEADGRALASESGLPTVRERAWVLRLLRASERAARDETKIATLARLTRRAAEPVVVFTEFRHSLVAVASRLGPPDRVAVLHGGQTAAERRSELQRFQDGAASILVATDVAGQGLNLQTRARWVVNLELPWNPARLEQRAGRVDRIGQTRSAHITLLVARHAMEAGVLAHVARRILAARTSAGVDLLTSPGDERRVRLPLLAGVPLDVRDDAIAAPRRCRRWTRLARAWVRQLEGRRQLADRWQGPSSEPTGPLVIRTRRHTALAPRGAAVAIWSAAIVDGTGRVLERQLIGTQIDQAPPDGSGPDAMAAARTLVECRIARRAERVRRRLARWSRVDEVREKHLADILVEDERRAERQAGLFDRRAAQAIDAADRAIVAATSAATRRAASGGGDRVGVGRMTLVMQIEEPR